MTGTGIHDQRTAAELRVLSSARWPETAADTVPPVAGFVESSFNPLVIEVADRCLRRHLGPPPATDAGAARTAVLLASVGGDRATARLLAACTETGRRVPPLFFFQSNPNAVLGYVAARWGLAGPVVCTCPTGPAEADAFAAAALLLRDGDADRVLTITAEQGAAPGEADSATAHLLTIRA